MMALPAYYIFKGQKDLAGNSLQKLDKNFTGFLLFYDWDENLLRGDRYAFGKKIADVAPLLKARNGRTKLELHCETVAIDHYSQTCVGGTCGEWTYSYTDYVTTCYTTGSDGGSDSGGGGNSGGGGSGGATSGGGGGGTGNGSNAQPEVILANIGDPSIPNIQKYLNCFGANQFANADKYNFKITIYVQEPMAGSGSSSSSSSGPINVGHACIGLTKTDKNDPSLFTNQVVGWYPQGVPGFGPLPSIFKDNSTGSFNYTVSITYDVDPGQFSRALYAISSLDDMNYSLSDYNCTTFIFNVLNYTGGISIPQNQAQIGPQTGYTPGQLGLDLRRIANSNPNIRTTPGIPLRSKGECD